MTALWPLLGALLLSAPTRLDPATLAENGYFGAIPAGALSPERLTDPDHGLDWSDPYVATLWRYLARCALPEGTSVLIPTDGEPVILEGQIGLAPEWAEGPCEEACQEWVSACLLALSNRYGVTVNLILVASTDLASDPDAEADESYAQEGAFFGNLFEPLPKAYSCRGTDYDPLMMTFRRCAQPDGGCGFTWVGTCGPIDGDTGLPASRRACTDELASSYPTCSNRATVDGAFPEPHRLYTRVITTWLRKTSFSPCPEGAAPWDPDTPARPPVDAANTCTPDATRSCIGERCFNDDGCPGEDLFCEGGGLSLGQCTRACTTDAPDDDDACGDPAATCAMAGQGYMLGPRCLRSCSPSATTDAPEGCPPYQICTSHWWSLDPGAPSCQPWCAQDTDCVEGAVCEPRRGGCTVPPLDPTGREDGEPCRTDRANPCRGDCWFLFGGDDPRGLCISQIDLRERQTCFSPDVIAYSDRQSDGIGLCAFKRCTSSLQCTPPLVCRLTDGGVFGGAGGICDYPEAP